MTIRLAIVTTLRYGAHSCWEELNGTDHLHLLLTTTGKLPTTRTLSAKDLIGRAVIGSLVVVHTNVKSAILRTTGQRIVRKK